MNSPKKKYIDLQDHLSEAQLLRYQEGRMEEAEMHRVEQHLLACSFCEEALEGIILLEPKAAESALKDLRHNFSEKLGKEKSTTSYWKWGVAASLLLLFSASIFLVLKPLENDRREVAQKAQKREDPLPITKEKVDSSTSSHQSAIVYNTPTNSNRDVENNRNFKLDRNQEKPNSTKEEALEQATLKPEEEAPQVSSTLPSLDTALPFPEAIGDITFEEAGGITNAYSTNRSVILSPEKAETSNIPSSPSQTLSQKDLKSNVDMHLNVQDVEAETLSETVVEDIEINKKESKAKAPVSPAHLTTPSPVNGIGNFNKYIKEDRSYSDEAREKGIEGNVVIEFSVAPDSTLSQFKVLESLGYGLDEEAIRLLKAGPKWVPANINGRIIHQKAIVEVPFLLD